MHFSHQTLKPGYAPAARWLHAGIPRYNFWKISGFLNKAKCARFFAGLPTYLHHKKPNLVPKKAG